MNLNKIWIGDFSEFTAEGRKSVYHCRERRNDECPQPEGLMGELSGTGELHADYSWPRWAHLPGHATNQGHSSKGRPPNWQDLFTMEGIW